MMESSQTERILMAQKLAALKIQLQEDFKVSYELIPKPDAPYDTKKQQLNQLLQTQYTLGNLDKVDDILLGAIQGMATQVSAKILLKQKFGIQNQPILDEYLKNKIDFKSYGLKKKDKGKQIYEVKNQKLLETLYNLKDVKNARKLRTLYRNMIKAISKFIELYEKKSDKSTSQLFSFYTKAFEQQRKFLEFKGKTEIAVIQKDVPLPIITAQVVQILPEVQENIQQVPEENIVKSEKSDEQIKTNLGSGEKSKKERKKDKRQEKQKKPKSKKEKPENQTKVDIQSDASSFSVPPKKKEQPKLQNFFKLTPKKLITNEIINQEPDHQNSISCTHALKLQKLQQPAKSKEQLKQIDQNSFINKLLSQQQEYKLSDLRNQIIIRSMDEEKTLTEKYVNIVFWDSMLQYQNYPAPFCYFMQFTQPFKYQEQIRYLDDSADIYEDLIGENLEENNDNQMEQQQQGEYSGNNTIVPDDYFSEVQISSQGQQMKGIKTFKILDGREQLWSFSRTDYTQKVQQYKMVLLCQQFMPLQIIESNLQNQNLPLSIKIALLKQIHGYYKPRQNLLKQLGLITDKLSKNGLNNFIKQNSSKVGNQRIIKQQIIDEIRQGKQDIDKELEDAKKIKDIQLQQTQQIKNNEKQLKLQKAILQYEGSKYILNLVQHLKEKQFKISKKQLDEFICSRTGEAWQDIKKDFKKIKRKQGKDKEKQVKEKQEKQKQSKILIEPQQNLQPQPQTIKLPQKTSAIMKSLSTIFKQIEEQYENDPQKLNQIRRKKEEKLKLQQQELMREKMKKQQIQQKQVNYGDDPEDPDYDDPTKKKKKAKKIKKEETQNKMDVENMCEQNEEIANKQELENQANEKKQLPTKRKRKQVNYRKFIEDD